MSRRVLIPILLASAAGLLWLAATQKTRRKQLKTLRRTPSLFSAQSPTFGSGPQIGPGGIPVLSLTGDTMRVNLGDDVTNFVQQFKVGLARANKTIINLLKSAANTHGVPQNLLLAQAYAESNFNPNARPKGGNARGVMQLIPRWHPGTNVNKIPDNIFRGAEYLRENFDKFGEDWYNALVAYKEGDTLLRKLGINSNDTRIIRGRNYADKILAAAGMDNYTFI